GIISIGEVHANIAQGQRAQHGVANGMQQHVGIAVPQPALVMGHLYAAQPERAPCCKLMKIYSLSYTYFSHYLPVAVFIIPAQVKTQGKAQGVGKRVALYAG